MLHQDMKYKKVGFQLRAKLAAAKLEIKILYWQLKEAAF